MATIDYKEKYEQALERARQFSEKPYLEDSAGIVEYIFPELKESEDGIRKALISFLKSPFVNENITDEKVAPWIAWLEKQGMPAKYHDICDTCVRQPTCQSDCFLQQSEQKPTDKVEPKFKIGDRVKIKGRTAKGDVIRNIYQAEDGNTYFEFENSDDAPADCDWELVEEPKKCMFTKEEFTEEDRKILCEDCEEECEYAKKEEPVSEDLEKAAVEAFKQIVDENRNSFLEIFKAGAQWMHKKMIHEFNLKEK